MDSLYSIMKNEWYFGKDDENLEQDLIDSALYGMSSSALDPHTTYMSAEQTLAFSTAIDNNFVGIGIQYNASGPKIVTRVFADSPAYHAGVQVGDILMKADGQDLTDLPSDDVADLVRGEAGTQVDKELQTSFDYSKIKYTEDYYDTDMNPDAEPRFLRETPE